MDLNNSLLKPAFDTGFSSKKDTVMKSRVQELAERINMTYYEFLGEMRKLGCSEPTASKIWRGDYQNFDSFTDNDMYLSNLRKAAFVLKATTKTLMPDD